MPTYSQTQQHSSTSPALLTPIGLPVPTDSSIVTTAYMYWILAVYACRYCNARTTICYLDISARQRLYTKSSDTMAQTPEFIMDYCKSCTTCSHAKPPWHKPYGLLKQLPVPEKPWNSISMDFIEQIPSSSGHTSILVIIDHLSKQSLFILMYDTIT